MDRTPKPMEQYLHFKGGRYQVLNLAQMEDTGETLVIYQALYGEGRIYARRLESFLSEVDRDKYPDAVQRYRFLRVLPPEEDAPRGEAVSCAESVSRAETALYAESVPCAETAFRAGSVSCAEDAPCGESAAGGQNIGKPVSEEKNSEESVAGELNSEDSAAAEHSAEESDYQQADPCLMRFLDAQTAEEKLSVLFSVRGQLTDDLLDSMAFSMGIGLQPGPVEARLQDLKECLMTISRYELDRGRFRKGQ